MRDSRLMYNENEDAVRVLENGFTDGYTYKEALAVAKYYRKILGFGDARVKTKLIAFCKEHDRLFREHLKRNSIRNIVKESNTDFRNTTQPIIVSESELNTIRAVKNFKYQKVLLGLLVVAKLNKRNFVKTKEYRIIRRIVSKYFTNKLILDCIFEGYRDGLFGEPKEQNQTLLYISEDINGGFIIHNDRELFNLSSMYQKWCGGELIYCKNCNKEIIRNGRGHKFCEDCWTKRRREKVKNNVERHRTKTLESEIFVQTEKALMEIATVTGVPSKYWK